MLDTAQNSSERSRSFAPWKRLAALTVGTLALLSLAGRPTPPDPQVIFNPNNTISINSASILQSGIMDTESERSFVPGQVLVQNFMPSVSTFPYSLAAGSADGFGIVQVQPGREQEAIDDLKTRAGVFAQPNYIYEIAPDESEPASETSDRWEDNVLQTYRPDVQAKVNELTEVINRDLKLIIVDTGCADIPQFHGQITQLTVLPSGNFYTGNHGTEVASQIIGDSGIIPKALLTCINAFALDNSATTYDLVNALNKAKEIGNGKAIINNSWGGVSINGPDMAINNAVYELILDGNYVLFANGNTEAVNPFVHPGSLSDNTPGLVSASASTRGGRIAYFSNAWGKKRFVLPGEGVLAFDAKGEPVFVNGTSFSIPNLLGFSALFWGQNPTLSNLQLEQLMLNQATKINSNDQVFGDGTFILPEVVGLEADPYFTHAEVSPSIVVQSQQVTITLDLNNLSNETAVINLYDAEAKVIEVIPVSVQNGNNNLQIKVPETYAATIYPKLKIGNGPELDLPEFYTVASTQEGHMVWGDSFTKSHSIRTPINYEKTGNGFYFSFINHLPRRNQVIIVSPNTGSGQLGPLAGVDKNILGMGQAFEIKATEVMSPTGVGFWNTPVDLDNSELVIFSNKGIYTTQLFDGIKYIESVKKYFDGNVVVGTVFNDLENNKRKLIWLEKNLDGTFKLRYSDNLIASQEINLNSLSSFDLSLEDQFQVKRDKDGLKVYLTNSKQIVIVNLDKKSVKVLQKNQTATSSIAIGDLDNDEINDIAYAIPGISQGTLQYYLSTINTWRSTTYAGFESETLKYFVGATTSIRYRESPAVYIVNGLNDVIVKFTNGIPTERIGNGLVGSIQHFQGHIPGTNYFIALTGPLRRGDQYLGVTENLVVVSQLEGLLDTPTTTYYGYLPLLQR